MVRKGKPTLLIGLFAYLFGQLRDPLDVSPIPLVVLTSCEIVIWEVVGNFVDSSVQPSGSSSSDKAAKTVSGSVIWLSLKPASLLMSLRSQTS